MLFIFEGTQGEFDKGFAEVDAGDGQENVGKGMDKINMSQLRLVA